MAENTSLSPKSTIERLKTEVFLLSHDIDNALEEEQRLLAALLSAPRADVWAVLRTNDSSFGLQRCKEEWLTSSASKHSGGQDDSEQFLVSEDTSPSSSQNGTLREEKDRDGISFGEFSSMDSTSKRARIRYGLLRQEDKIRTLLERMHQRDKAAYGRIEPGSSNSI